MCRSNEEATQIYIHDISKKEMRNTFKPENGLNRTKREEKHAETRFSVRKRDERTFLF